MRTEEQIKKFRADVAKQLETASPENVKWLQGCIFGLDYPETKDEDGLSD